MRTARLVAFHLSVLFVAQAGATTHVVDVNGGHDFTAIGTAVMAAADGDTILVNPGTYSGTTNRDINVGTRNLVIRSTSGPSTTTIDCEGAGRAFAAWTATTDTTTVISGFTIANGWARAFPEDGGGAIVAQNASPVIEDCVFNGNEGNYGGAVKLLYSNGIVRSCAFRGNAAVAAGGLHSAYGTPIIARCTFAENTASPSSGGACRVYRGSTTFRDCTFAANSSGAGGCLEFDGLPVVGTVERCIVAFSAQGYSVYGTDATTTHSIIFANAGGDSLLGAHHDNHFEDPLFCGLATADLRLCANSWGIAANNSWGVDVGSQPEGCESCGSPVDGASWGAIKRLFR